MTTFRMSEDIDQQTMISDELHVSMEDLLPLQVTPEPGGNYRCPVSTPALSMSTEVKLKRFNSANETSYATTRGFGQRSAHCRRATEISYPHYIYRKRHPTRTNLDYYYRFPRPPTVSVANPGDQALDENVSPRWLKTMTSQPFDELYDQYKRKSEVNSTFDSRLTCYRTPGELSLMKGWEKNAGQSSVDYKSDKAASEAVPEPCAHKAFPPGKKLLIRSQTLSEDGFDLNRRRELKHSARVSRWNGGLARMPNDTLSDNDRNSMPNGTLSDNVSPSEQSGTTWNSNSARKRFNNLNFRKRLISPEKKLGQFRINKGSDNLPDILIKTTNFNKVNQSEASWSSPHKSGFSTKNNTTAHCAASVELASSNLKWQQRADLSVNENKYGLSKSAPCIISFSTETSVGKVLEI